MYKCSVESIRSLLFISKKYTKFNLNIQTITNSRKVVIITSCTYIQHTIFCLSITKLHLYLSNVRPEISNKQIVLKIRWRNTFNDDNLSPIKMCPSSFAFIEVRENCFSHSSGHILFSTDVCVDIFSNMKSNPPGLMQCIEMMRLPKYNEASNHQIEFFKDYVWDKTIFILAWIKNVRWTLIDFILK